MAAPSPSPSPIPVCDPGEGGGEANLDKLRLPGIYVNKTKKNTEIGNYDYEWH